MRVTAEKSPRKRAFYFSKFECWLPLPELTNYSGYDRDNDSGIRNQTTQLQTFEQTKLQSTQDEIELVFQKLLDAPTTDIKEAIKLANPQASDSALDNIILRVKVRRSQEIIKL